MKIFIGSSKENEILAKWIEEMILAERLPISTQGWWDATSFPIGNSTYESLSANMCQAAIIIAGKEDLTLKREDINFQPRDNVIFEIGLFAGKNGRENTLIAMLKGTELPSDLRGISVLELIEGDEYRFKSTNRSAIRHWLQKLISGTKSVQFSDQFPNLYKTVVNIIDEVKQLKRSIDPQTVDLLASNIFSQLTFSLSDDNYIAGFLLNRIESEMKDCTGIFATDVLGPSAWISPTAYRYLSIQIKNYIRKNTYDEKLQLIVDKELGESIDRACNKVKDMTGIGQSFSWFDNPEDFVWQVGKPKLQFARILLWSREELLSSIGESIIAIHQAFNVPIFFLEVPQASAQRGTDFILFEKTKKDDSNVIKEYTGFYNSKAKGFKPLPIVGGLVPNYGNAKKAFDGILKDNNLMLAIDARYILKGNETY